MKKIFILLLAFLLVGCSSANSSIKQADIKGYWGQVERDWSGDIDDMSDNMYAYLEITDNRLHFYTESTTDKGYYETIASKYYILEDNKIYYDYYELKGDKWKDNISESGGIFHISFDKDKLVLTKYYNDLNKDDGYDKDTYIKVKDSDRLKSY